ncbi:hypothetical protein FJQ98_06650 [Lysinibacillus agricola]|uniref:Uncharacterized protein n=1 Tax=Lysinibacillus agricola TaxID=2590012 RepID=A0ABX7AUS9_9BACI|nr:hypothetical protein [Lysinibacillus agricola]QQP13726.1 hypothetical protein FJQ98_06650 [Lysinibacillus agricola]
MHCAFAQKTFVAPTPPGSIALCESEATATKRPVGTEITPVFAEEPYFI